MKTTVSLNGTWKFAPTHDQKPNNNRNMIDADTPLYAYPSLNRRDWESVPVPGVWQRYAEKYSIYEGVCWFCREFTLENMNAASLVKIVFKGVNYRADVYINGKFAGSHESGYTEFSFDISALVQEGKNFIAVQVDNRPIIVKWPNDWGYGVFGGIHRDVFVEVYSESSVYDVSVNPNYDVEKKTGTLKVSGRVMGSVGAVSVKLGGDMRKIPCCDGKFSAELVYDGVETWSPKTPTLYDLEISAGEQIYRKCRVGFRNICCRDRKILLNGREFVLNGACYVYDSPRYGLVMDREQLRQDLLKMKEANVNAVRTHYPMSDDFYELCDEMGFLVWIEPNIYCSKPADEQVNTVFGQQEMADAAVSMTQEMVLAAQTYACVAIYGIGNECNTDHPEAVPFFERISAAVRALDNTRPIGFASLYGRWLKSIVNVIDILGINSYYGWYGTMSTVDIEDKLEIEDGRVKMRRVDVSSLHELIVKTANEIPEDMPILLTEFGADSVPGYYSRACEFWSENYHAEVIRAVVNCSREHEEVVGTFVFAFTDYNDPSKPMNGRWNGLNLKGMLTYHRDYKLPFYALQEVYATPTDLKSV